MRLEAPRLGALHVLADVADARGVHRIVREGSAASSEVLESPAVEGVVDTCVSRALYLGLSP